MYVYRYLRDIESEKDFKRETYKIYTHLWTLWYKSGNSATHAVTGDSISTVIRPPPSIVYLFHHLSEIPSFEGAESLKPLYRRHKRQDTAVQLAMLHYQQPCGSQLLQSDSTASNQNMFRNEIESNQVGFNSLLIICTVAGTERSAERSAERSVERSAARKFSLFLVYLMASHRLIIPTSVILE